MIIRILGEGQYDVSDDAVDRLNRLDAEVESAVAAGDEAAFSTALSELLDTVRSIGVPHALDSIDSSDVVLPPSDASLEEVRESLEDDGLIPG